MLGKDYLLSIGLILLLSQNVNAVDIKLGNANGGHHQHGHNHESEKYNIPDKILTPYF